MTLKLYTIFIVIFTLLGCSKSPEDKNDQYSDLINLVKNIEDSISIDQMTIHNAFKHQILAHSEKEFDSLRILNKVYQPNKYVFDNCLGLIFGDDNGKLFKPNGMYGWNKDLLRDQDSLVRAKLSVLDSLDLNQLFTNHLTAVQEITGQPGIGNWMVYFGPENFQIFGGCDNNSMVLDMFGDSWNTKSINEVFAHEIEHLIFGPILEKDTNANTGIGITIDEGLAQYFTYKYLNQTLDEAFYGERTQILIDREKEIFNKLAPYLFKSNAEGCPIFRHCGRNNECEAVVLDLPQEMEGNLCYFLGFRIIQKYEENNGEGSWKDVYHIPLSEFYKNSGYQEFIENTD